MPLAGFEPAVPAIKRPKAYAIDRAITEIGSFPYHYHVAQIRPWSSLWGFVKITFYGAGLLVQRPTPNLEDLFFIYILILFSI
jgi:hypothetical protein